MLKPAALVALALGLGLSACASTSGPRLGQGELVATQGTVQGRMRNSGSYQLGPFSEIDTNCRRLSDARARILRAPGHGKLSIARSRGDIAFDESAPLSHCNDKPVVGTVLRYTPKRDYVGPDVFAFELTFRDGERRRIAYELQVTE